MLKSELRWKLLGYDISPERFSVDGGKTDGVISLRRNGTRWEVYYYEQGVKNVLGTFDREEDACSYLFTSVCVAPTSPDQVIADERGMTRRELKERLKAAGIKDNAYSLDGRLYEDRVGVRWNGLRWEVNYFERGEKTVLGVFKKERDACQFVYDDFMLPFKYWRCWYDRDDLRRDLNLRLEFEGSGVTSVVETALKRGRVKIGIPREIKPDEGRVSLTPSAVKKLTDCGCVVLVQSGTGEGSKLTAPDYRLWSGRYSWPEPAGVGFADEEYERAGAVIVSGSRGIYEEADIIVKVAEPQDPEYDLLREGQTLVCFLDLISNRELTETLVMRGVTAIGYETVQTRDGVFPIVAAMDEIAGATAVYIGTYFLADVEVGSKSKEVLVEGVEGIPAAEVVIIGGGAAGTSAARVAAAMGARVTILDPDPGRVRRLVDALGPEIKAFQATDSEIERALREADVVIGALERPYGTTVPKLVTEETVERMSSHSVIVDIAPERGSCFETVDRTLNPAEPIFHRGAWIAHYSVPDIARAAPRTSSIALSDAVLPYVLDLACKGLDRAVRENPALARGVQVVGG